MTTNNTVDTKEYFKKLLSRTRRVDVESTSIKTVSYNSTLKMLIIEFHNGRPYPYENVPEGVFLDLISSPSVGRFYQLNIKGKFRVKEDTGAAI